MVPFDIVIPARNEAVALVRTAPALKRALQGLPANVIYVLNATTDGSAEVIRQTFGSAVSIVSIEESGKTVALNKGDDRAGRGPRVYLDADVCVAMDMFPALLGPLAVGAADLVAPRLEVDLEGAGPVARRVGRVWADQLGRRPDAYMNCTAFSQSGLARRGPWPNVLADDDWARDRIDPARRMIVETARAQITPPRDLLGWLTVRARWIRGGWELGRLGLAETRAMRVPVRGTMPDLAAYYAIRLAAAPVAIMQRWVGADWGQDRSSRKPHDA